MNHHPARAPEGSRAPRLTEASAELPPFGSQGLVRVPNGTSGRSRERMGGPGGEGTISHQNAGKGGRWPSK